MTNREMADKLVRDYGSKLRVAHAALDDANDCSFGDAGVHYDPARGILTGRILILRRSAIFATPESNERARTAMTELNSPRISELFERGGGYFDYEEPKRMIFLKKDFVVDGLPVRAFLSQMDELSDVAAKWEFRWLRWTMAIIYGQAPLPNPPIPVTRENDSQHNEFDR